MHTKKKRALESCKRSKVWLPDLNKTKAPILHRMSLEEAGLCTQWITGFCNLQRHKHKKDNRIDDSCRLCFEPKETPEHLSFYCPHARGLYRPEAISLSPFSDPRGLESEEYPSLYSNSGLGRPFGGLFQMILVQK